MINQSKQYMSLFWCIGTLVIQPEAEGSYGLYLDLLFVGRGSFVDKDHATTPVQISHLKIMKMSNDAKDLSQLTKPQSVNWLLKVINNH